MERVEQIFGFARADGAEAEEHARATTSLRWKSKAPTDMHRFTATGART